MNETTRLTCPNDDTSHHSLGSDAALTRSLKATKPEVTRMLDGAFLHWEDPKESGSPGHPLNFIPRIKRLTPRLGRVARWLPRSESGDSDF